MKILLTYLIEFSIGLGVFYLFYHLLLRQSRHFQWNRYYLLGSAVLMLCIPLLQWSVPTEARMVREVVVSLQTFTVTPNQAGQWMASNTSVIMTSLAYWLMIIYGIGTSLLACRLLLQLGSFYRLSKQVNKMHCGDYWLIESDQQNTFSFFHYLFLNPTDLTKEQKQQIIRHEEVHIRQQHTFDILFFELLTLVFWFNPIIYSYKQAIRDTHEYLADAGVLEQQPQNRKQYAQLIVQQVLSRQNLYLFNHFSQSQIQKRIMMMNTTIKTRFMPIRYAFIVPLLMTVCLWFACNEASTPEEPDQIAEMKKVLDEAVETGELEPEVADDVKAVTEARFRGGNTAAKHVAGEMPNVTYTEITEVPVKDEGDDAYTVVEEMPEFPGGQPALFQYIGENIKYPEIGKNNGIAGMVFTQFVIDEQGAVTDAKILRGLAEEFDLEALRVVRAMPNWKPGKQDGKVVKVKYTLPFKFKLD